MLAPVVLSTPNARMPPLIGGGAVGATGSVIPTSPPHAATTSATSASLHRPFIWVLRGYVFRAGTAECVLRRLGYLPGTTKLPTKTRGFADRPRGRGAIVGLRPSPARRPARTRFVSPASGHLTASEAPPSQSRCESCYQQHLTGVVAPSPHFPRSRCPNASHRPAAQLKFCLQLDHAVPPGAA